MLSFLISLREPSMFETEHQTLDEIRLYEIMAVRYGVEQSLLLYQQTLLVFLAVYILAQAVKDQCLHPV